MVRVSVCVVLLGSKRRTLSPMSTPAIVRCVGDGMAGRLWQHRLARCPSKEKRTSRGTDLLNGPREASANSVAAICSTCSNPRATSWGRARSTNSILTWGVRYSVLANQPGISLPAHTQNTMKCLLINQVCFFGTSAVVSVVQGINETQQDARCK